MKRENERILRSWAPVLVEFLDPIKFIEALPRIFVIGSHDYSMVNNNARQPCEAVKIAIDVILRSDVVIDDVVSAISGSGHKWLAHLINGNIEDHEVEMASEQFSACEEIKKILTISAPLIKTTIDGQLVAQNLKECDHGSIITEGDLQRVECRYREEGNEASVRLLLSILMRCEPGWWDIFTKVVEEIGYDVNLVKTMQYICSLYQPTHSPTDRTETDHGFLDESVQGASAASPSNEDKSTQAHPYADVQVLDFPDSNDVIDISRMKTLTDIIIKCYLNASGICVICIVVPSLHLAEDWCRKLPCYLPLDKWHIYVVQNDELSMLSNINSSSVVIMTSQAFTNLQHGSSVKFNLIFFECPSRI